MRVYILYLLLALIVAGCHSGITSKHGKFQFIETIISGNDTGMYSLAGFQKKDVRDILCQHWELAGMGDISSIDQVMDKENKRIYPELSFFKDSSVLENPRSHVRIGSWHIDATDRGKMLTLNFSGSPSVQYLVQNCNAHQLWLVYKGRRKDSLYIHLTGEALIHQNMHNDPFHPINNQWRIKPAQPESDAAIKERVKQCIRFYALFYRDNIVRRSSDISFLGLPHIFEWYRRGIGLPDRSKVDESWIECFYNKEQALKGYDLLRDLIVQYEFNWPEHAPSWVYETHSVLEQMYHKL